MMSCRGHYVWSLSDLVGAFVDLAIAYFFLCVSAVAYIPSKFLGFFGLCLACPFSNYCVQGLLIDCPTERVSNVLLSVRNKFPFNQFGIQKGVNSNFGGDVMNERSRRRRRRDVDDNQTSRVISVGERDAILAYEFLDENDEEEKLSSFMVAIAEPPKKIACSCGDKDAVKILEQALKKDQAVRAALYIELEKERSAAASAADEAMAMILRLQEEKATVEMEARQYQRIIEEKFAYDAEEMNILKDILLIRQKENHSLQKEVEEYRQMINLGSEQFQEDAVEFEKKHLDSLVTPSKYPVFTIDQPSASSVDKKTSLKDIQTSRYSRNGEQTVQEKEIIPICGHLHVPPQHEQSQLSTTISSETSSSQEDYLFEKRIQILGEQSILDGQGFLQDKMDCCGTNDSRISRRESMENQNNEALDEVKKSIVVMSDKGQSIGVIENCARSSNLHGGTEGTSDIFSRLPPISSGQQRNSMSSMDNERIKIDREIGWLQDRLKVIQEGREKLNLSKEPQEREHIQLKLLEDIVRQLQAIRLLTESGKAVRQASLPFPSTKVPSKKRRSRSASSGVLKGL